MAIIVEREKTGIGQIEVRTPWIEAKLPTKREIKFIYAPAPAEEVPPPPPPRPSFWEQYKVPIMIGGGVLLLLLLLRR
jgi:hypothetical protein